LILGYFFLLFGSCGEMFLWLAGRCVFFFPMSNNFLSLDNLLLLINFFFSLKKKFLFLVRLI
jgi:hypothetical protein